MGSSDSTPKLDLLCFGEPMLEFSQVNGAQYLQGFGGDTANCAVAAARHGARTGMLTALGDDPFGSAFLELWNQEGLVTDHVLIDPTAHTGVYFVSHDSSGHQFSYLRAGSAASRIGPQQISAQAVATSRWVMLSGISQAISASACDAGFALMQQAREQGVRVAYDTNLRLALWPLSRARAVIQAAIGLAHVVLPGHEDAALLVGREEPDAIVDAFLELGPEVVALTLGRDGVLVATRDAREHIAAHRVDAVDATGAGDAFDGAFLARLAAGDDPFTAGRYANVAAALSTLGHGAVTPLPRPDDVLPFVGGND